MWVAQRALVTPPSLSLLCDLGLQVFKCNFKINFGEETEDEEGEREVEEECILVLLDYKLRPEILNEERDVTTDSGAFKRVKLSKSYLATLRKKLVRIIRKRQSIFLRCVMRRQMLEKLLITGNIQGKKRQRKEKENISHWSDHLAWKKKSA